jgi:hypothetical protein
MVDEEVLNKERKKRQNPSIKRKKINDLVKTGLKPVFKIKFVKF